MRTLAFLTISLLALSLSACRQPQAATHAQDASSADSHDDDDDDAELLSRGEYMATMAGCHDCHTPGYAQAAGNVPRDQWLVGSPMGYSGPWGTTYAINLRLKVADMDDAAWLEYTGGLHTRPIMPDFNLRAMKERDRLAIFRFIKSLGVAGQPAPAYLPPGQKPPPPYMELVLPPGPPPGGAVTPPAPG